MFKSLAVAVMIIGSSISAMCWGCSNPLAERVVVPSNTKGTYGDGDGQLALYQGKLYECEVVPKNPKGKTTTTTNNTSNSNSNANSSSNSSATGGNANQTQGQTQSQSNTSANNNASSATGNGDNANNSVTNVAASKIPVNTAIAPPVFSTANCFKGVSGGAQTMAFGASFGGGKIDTNCAALSTAQNLYAMGSRLAACKVIITTKSAKAAGVTIDDCMTTIPDPVATVAPVVPPVTPVVVNVPAPAPADPQIVYIERPQDEIVVTAPKPAAHSAVKKKKKVAPIGPNCVVTPEQATK
jgi:hypothetical protein